MTIGPGSDDSVGKPTFGIRPPLKSLSDETQRPSVAHFVSVGFVPLEAGGEGVGPVKDFLCTSWHGVHLKYFARALIAWTMIGPLSESITPISRRFPA